MKTKSLRLLFFMTLLVVMLSSCSKKQEAIHRLQNFTEDVEENGQDWSVEEWKEKAKVFANLRAEMSQYDYDSKDQQKIGRLEGRCATAFANRASGGLLKRIRQIGNEIQGALNGFTEGVDNSLDEDSNSDEDED